jgi:transitional endoplasmic reticulum ATPase
MKRRNNMASNKPARIEADSPADSTERLADMLAQLTGKGGTKITGDAVEFHDGTKIIIPRGMTFEAALKILQRLKEDAETPTDFRHFFRYRADDGAYAALQVIKKRYGMLLGEVIDMGFFGKINAQTRDIAIDVGQTMQVPWGLISIPTCPGLELYLAETNDKDYGRIFAIQGSGPRKYREEVEALFDDIEDYLRTNSIYRGRAIIGSNDPEFLDLANFKPEQIVFSNEVMNVLEGTVWAPIKYTDAMRREEVPLKRAVLLYGPYGTGKTSAGQLTAKAAVDNGWTFISARPGRDKVEDVLRTARLYQPAVVFVEDIDNESSTGEQDEVTKLLEAFDGITAKGGELMVVMTTNHISRIHRGMLRPGRLDAVVEIAGLDRDGIEKLVRVVVGDNRLAADTDFDQVAEAMDGFYPAFVRESITRAVTFAIDRNEGSREYVIGTLDLVGAAHSLRPQLDILHEAGEGTKKPTLEVALAAAVRSGVLGLQVQDNAHQEVNLITEPEQD